MGSGWDAVLLVVCALVGIGAAGFLVGSVILLALNGYPEAAWATLIGGVAAAIPASIAALRHPR
jgi:hypothetical protein